MKRYGNLFEQIASYDNLERAFYAAAKNKRWQKSVIETEKHLKERLEAIQKMLLDGTFVSSKYKIKIIYEPKEREIFVLPFYPDRIIHHAIMNIIEPIWLKLFIDDSYACISGRGQHAGSRRTMEMVCRNAYCLKCDVRKFYPSINHDVLYKIIKRKIKCEKTLELLEKIVYSIDGETNVPIGNYTSQWMGNLYLNELDTFVKHTLKVKDYVRYCDDFILFSNDKKFLNECKKLITEFLKNKLKLTLKIAEVFPTSQGIDFLGYRHFPGGYILLRKSTAIRIKRKVKKLTQDYEQGKITAERVRNFLASIDGWLRWANTHNLKYILDIKFLMGKFRYECRKQQNNS